MFRPYGKGRFGSESAFFLIRAGGLCNINSSLIVWIDKAALPVRITEGGLTDRLQRARGIIE